MSMLISEKCWINLANWILVELWQLIIEDDICILSGTYIKIYNCRICTINIVNDTFWMIILRKITWNISISIKY